ncbi:hypothetical protein M422DRAFT_221387 [Sphaerobolus stellatus SS14]|nr:hypothetical protein M422DRAFT_221387 [Sphaerobolus stellatus SS14]
MSVLSDTLDGEAIEKHGRSRVSGSSNSREQLIQIDRFWVDYRAWLETRGYRLYVGHQHVRKKLTRGSPQGVQRRTGLDMVHAERMSDGLNVMLKRVSPSGTYSQELKVIKFFSTETVVMDPRNHCIPLLDVVQAPTYDEAYILVMPCLLRYDEPRFITVGEVVEFLRQTFEGIQYMHEHHTTVGSYTVMMDVSLNSTHHGHGLKVLPKKYCRTKNPPRYFLVDFTLSHRFLPEDGPPLALPYESGDSSAPEHQGQNANRPCDPFPTDIFYLGTFIEENFLASYHGLEFIEPLVREMRQRNTVHRPTIDQITFQFERIYLSLTTPKLRSRIVPRNESSLAGMYYGIMHTLRRVKWALCSTPPIPQN